jgi:hypothetical protein
MAFFSKILGTMSEGHISFTVSLDGGDLVQIRVKDKKIVIELKSALLALKFGLKEYLSASGKDSKEKDSGKKKKGKQGFDMSVFDNIKKAGYKVYVKYGILEFEI